MNANSNGKIRHAADIVSFLRVFVGLGNINQAVHRLIGFMITGKC